MNQTDIIKPHPKYIRLFFFWAGIIATFAYRVILLLNLYLPGWVNTVWYIGTVGFILYFYHRYDVEKKRAELVEGYKLEEYISQLPQSESLKHQALEYIVRTSRTSKSRYNSLFIFWLSVVALIVGAIFDIFQIGV